MTPVLLLWERDLKLDVLEHIVGRLKLEQTGRELPSPFPEEIAESISKGMLHRLGQIEQPKLAR